MQTPKGDDESASMKAIEAPSGILNYSTSASVIELLQDKDWRIRRKAFEVIRNTSIFTDDELVKILQDRGWNDNDILRVMPDARLGW